MKIPSRVGLGIVNYTILTPPPEGIAQPIELTYFLVLLLALKKAPDLINDILHWKLIKQYFDTGSADQNDFLQETQWCKFSPDAR